MLTAMAVQSSCCCLFRSWGRFVWSNGHGYTGWEAVWSNFIICRGRAGEEDKRTLRSMWAGQKGMIWRFME